MSVMAPHTPSRSPCPSRLARWAIWAKWPLASSHNAWINPGPCWVEPSLPRTEKASFFIWNMARASPLVARLYSSTGGLGKQSRYLTRMCVILIFRTIPPAPPL